MGKRKHDGMGERRFTTEICLSIVTSNSMVFRPGMLHHLGRANTEAKETIKEASIYLICSRPRLRILRDSLSRDGTDLHFQFNLETGEGIHTFDAVTRNAFQPGSGIESARISDSMSFHMEFLDAEFKNALNLPVDMLVPPSAYPDETLADYEVLYVGQSRVGKSSGDISSRLVSHATLQRILTDTNENAPHKDIFIMCFKLEDPRYISMVDPHVSAVVSDDEDTRHFVDVHMKPPTSEQITNIAEACYIRYFQPPYNKLLKRSVPSPELRLLKVCYHLDLNAVLTEINTEDIGARIYSQAVKPAFHHMVPFEIHSPDSRRRFFVLSQPDGSHVELFPEHAGQ